MTPSLVFSIVSTIVTPMWLLLVFLPNHKITRWLIDTKFIPILLAFVYASYIIPSLLSNGMMDFRDLASVMELFTDEKKVLAGWTHFLAFDLFLGMWMVEKNDSLKIHPVLMTPILISTLMFGPLGFICFMSIKMYKEKVIKE